MEENRRVKLTKKLIQDAFLELLEKRPLAKINVTEICRLADVNRSTFYAYYNDVQELLHEIENDVLSQIPVSKQLPAMTTDNKEFLRLLEKLFSYVKQNERLFKALIIKTDSNAFTRKLVETILRSYPKDTAGKSEVILNYGYIYAIYGAIGVLMEWILTGFPVSEKVFARIVLEMSIRANDITDKQLGL